MQKEPNLEMQHMRAVVTEPQSPKKFSISKVPLPVPANNQALIKVMAFSLNQGETRTALEATNSYIPGWDFAGVIEKPAADGSTLPIGTRVFGYIPRGSWAEYLVAPAGMIAEIPTEITNAQAAAIPIAGLTAIGCLEESGNLFNRSILITGASGGVGRFACQLAALAGAKVFAVSRRPTLLELLEQDGVKPAGVFASVTEAKLAGSYDVVWDSIGGDELAIALTALNRNGVCINYGNSSRKPTTFDVRASGWPFHNIKCTWLGREPLANSTPVFNHLTDLHTKGKLHIPIDSISSWENLTDAIEKLLLQQVNGKIILEID